MPNAVNYLYEFDNFIFDGETKTLRRNSELIPLSPKALDLLGVLIEKQGDLVTKQEIFEKVWPDTFVEDGVLSQNIYILRNALGKNADGKQLIENISRKGYRFTAKVTTKEKRTAEPVAAVEENQESNVSSHNSNLNSTSPDGSNAAWKKRALAIGAAAVALLGLGLVIFALLRKPDLTTEKPALGKMQFQRLTDTGDAAYLTVSPDGNFAAYSKPDGVFLKDLNSGGELPLKIENVSKFGCLQFSKDSASLYFGSLNEPNASGKIWQISRFGGIPKLIAENVWSGFSISPDGKSMAFVRKFPKENRQALTIRSLEGGSDRYILEKQLPEEFYWNNYPAWSPDGKKIAMVIVSRTEHFINLSVIDAESGKEEISPAKKFRNVEQVVWQSDGKSIIASASEGMNFQLWKIAYPEGTDERITNDLNSYLGISISADGKKLLSRQRIYYSNIWSANVSDLNTLTQLTSGTSRNDGLKGLAWLDEKTILYSTNQEKIRDWNIWSVDITDKSRRQVTADQETQNEFPVAAPDGKGIYFDSDRNAASRIWRINPDGTAAAQITTGESQAELFPQTSPDGNWLYYIQKSKEASAIWRRSLSDDTAQKLTIEGDLNPDTFLALSPDGKYLAFHNLTEKTKSDKPMQNFEIAMIPVENPEDVKFFDLTSTQALVVWSPDGKAFDYLTKTAEWTKLWRQSFDKGAKAELLLTLPKESIFNFAWSRDGKNLAIARGELLRDVVLLTNFN